jgi:hypothetical protein
MTIEKTPFFFVTIILFASVLIGVGAVELLNGLRQFASKVTEVTQEESRSQPINAANPDMGNPISPTRATWRTPTQPGMAPLQALKSTSAQMQYEQGTDLGSDANARALILVMEAVAILEGRDRTVDGFPVIE